MKKILRITDEEIDFLILYMDDKVYEEVAFRFAPCTNEEFLVQALLRNGITKEVVEEILELDFREIERTFMIIETIKSFIQCNNIIQYTKIAYPNRELCTEYSERGAEYRGYLNKYTAELERLKKEFPEFLVLSDLKEDFPEIDCCFKSEHVFYSWMDVIL
jgi:hypothetical protein